MTSESTGSELRSGDLLFCGIGGFVPGFVPVGVGQAVGLESPGGGAARDRALGRDMGGGRPGPLGGHRSWAQGSAPDTDNRRRP